MTASSELIPPIGQTDWVAAAITLMRERLDGPLGMAELAAAVGFSPFHFNRMFRATIGIPPGEYLAALRLDRARQLLLTTSLDVTQICVEVGYSSLGSFTTRFTRMFGLAPGQLRRQAEHLVLPAQLALLPAAGVSSTAAAPAGLSGHIYAPDDEPRLIFAGVFPRLLPQGTPLACTLLSAPGIFQIVDDPPLPAGHYFLLCAALPWPPTAQQLLCPEPHMLAGVSPLLRTANAWQSPAAVYLQAPDPLWPPLLVFLPGLLERWAKKSTHLY